MAVNIPIVMLHDHFKKAVGLLIDHPFYVFLTKRDTLKALLQEEPY